MTELTKTISLELLKATLNTLPDGVLLVNQQRKVIYFNDTFTKMWRIPNTVLHRGSSQEMVIFVRDQVEDAELFFSQVELLYGSEDSSRDELKLKDGRTLLRRSVHFELGELDKARIWIFSDIKTEGSSGSFSLLAI